jgi:hypothetical protein
MLHLDVSMDVTFRESEPFYGEKIDLSSSFSNLDSPVIFGEGEKEAHMLTKVTAN